VDLKRDLYRTKNSMTVQNLRQELLNNFLIEHPGTASPLLEELPEQLDQIEAMEEAVNRAVDIKLDLRRTGPFAEYLAHQRERAVLAAISLLTCDPGKPREIMALQMEAASYRAALMWARNALNDGAEIAHELSEHKAR